MIVATLFGTSDGLEVINLPVGQPANIKLEDGSVAFASQEVKLRNDADIFKIYRREVAGRLLTWIGLYRSATEIVSNRAGGYYGAGIWLYDLVVPSQLVVETLVNLADQIKSLAISDGKFSKRLSEVRGAIAPPAQVAMLLTSKKTRVTGVSPRGSFNALISNQVSGVIGTIEWAQASHSAELFNEVMIGRSDQFNLQQGQFQKPSERFDSLPAAIQWAYSKRVIQLDEQNKNRQSELERVGQQLALLNAESNAKKTEISVANESIRSLNTQLQLSEKNLTNARAEQERLSQRVKQAQTESEPLRQKVQTLEKGLKDSEFVIEQLSKQTHAGQISTQTTGLPKGPDLPGSNAAGLANKLSKPPEQSFFARNLLAIALAFVLVAFVVVAVFLLNQKSVASRDRVDSIEARYQEDLKKKDAEIETRKKNENALDNKIRELEIQLADLQRKSEPPKIDIKDLLTVDSTEKNKCLKTDLQVFKKFQYDIRPAWHDKKRAEIYKVVETECQLAQYKSCTVTIRRNIKDPFEAAQKKFTGDIVLPESCDKTLAEKYGDSFVLTPKSDIKKSD